jgi:hypothetical protein
MIPELWENLLEQLFVQERAFSHQLVLQEIQPTDYLGQWVSYKTSRFFPVTQRQTQLVTKILARVPGLIDHEKEIDEADPWIVALAIEKIESSTLLQDFSQVTVVSTESKRSPKRIPAVCQAFSVSHMDLRQFFDANGWRLKIETAR